MKNIISKAAGKVMFATAVVATIVGASAAVNAWWPERPTFTVKNPAPYVTFNSITDNPNYGDERTFYDVKDAANTSKGGFSDKVNVKDGQTLLLRTYVHNNAADSLNKVPDGKGGYKGVAENTKVRIHLPTASATSLRSNSYVSASNAKPAVVSDTVDFVGDNNFTLEYIPGSAVSYTNAQPSGMKLSDAIVTDGAPIGYDQLNGKIPGCFQYTSIVTVKVKVKMDKPNYTMDKKVAIPGQPWKENVTAKPGDTVSYLLTFKNTGNTSLQNVTVRDKLPANMQIVPGTTTITNTNNPNGLNAGTDSVVKNGINIGHYAPNSTAYVKFKAKVSAEDKLPCGTNKLINTGEAFAPSGPVVKDTADVYVNKECAEQKAYAECTLLNVEKVNGRTVRATVNYKAEGGAQFKHVTFNWGDNTNNLTTNTTAEHTYANNGNYVVTATVTFTIDGKNVDKTSATCAKPVEFSETPKELVNTGAGDVIAIFAAVTAAGAFAHRFVTARVRG